MNQSTEPTGYLINNWRYQYKQAAALCSTQESQILQVAAKNDTREETAAGRVYRVISDVTYRTRDAIILRFVL